MKIAGKHRCLEGYVVVDLTQYLSGPYCTFILGALGATVIKVEPKDIGDGNRHQPPFATDDGLIDERRSASDIGLAFLKRNACKLSVALDLKDDRGREVLLKLVQRADAFVHNFRPGVAEKLRIDAPALKSVNERLVYCGIDGYGSYAQDDAGVVDIVAQAVSGLMAVTGSLDGEPTRCSAPIADQVGGLFAAIAILSGLLQVKGGRCPQSPQAFSISMLHALSSLVWDEHHDVYFRRGYSERFGNGTPRNVPWNTYQASDGKYVAICAVSPMEWQRLVNATEIPEFNRRPEWSALASRLQHRGQIDRCIQEWVAHLPQKEAIERLSRHGVTAGPVNGIADILEDRRFYDTVLYQVQHPTRGVINALNARFPIVVDDTQLGPFEKAAPELGADSCEILQRYAGLSSEEVSRFLEGGFVGASHDVNQVEKA